MAGAATLCVLCRGEIESHWLQVTFPELFLPAGATTTVVQTAHSKQLNSHQKEMQSKKRVQNQRSNFYFQIYLSPSPDQTKKSHSTMLARTSRIFARSATARGKRMQIAFVHSSPTQDQSKTSTVAATATPAVNVSAFGDSRLSLLQHRLTVMAEVTVSKIFPAGFGWQTASVLAEEAGFAATEMPFFLATGVGDFVGVFVGHSTYYAIKQALGGKTKMTEELQTGFFLGSAAFCSGCVWQPSVNALTALGGSFNQVMIGTGAVCALAFFGGLRLGRGLYSKALPAVESNNYENLKADAGLSLSIGGATGFFVGTDISFGDADWLRGVVGVEEGMSAIEGEVRAGTSTALGFLALQSVQSVVLQQGKCWVD